MDQYNYQIDKIRFHLVEKNTLVITGFFFEDNPQKRKIEIYLDQQKLDFNIEIKDGIWVHQKYLVYSEDVNEGIVCVVTLPNEWRTYRKLRIFTIDGERRSQSAGIPVSGLRKREASLEYSIDKERIDAGQVQIIGWVIGQEPIDITVWAGGKSICSQIECSHRRDVDEILVAGESTTTAGFKIQFPIPENQKLKIIFRSGEAKSIYKTTLTGIKKEGHTIGNLVWKAIFYYRREGFGATLRRIQSKVTRRQNGPSYEKWLKKHSLSEEELEAQRREEFKISPLFSFVIPLYQTKKEYLKELIDSIADQTYHNWEVCFADGIGREGALQELVGEYQKQGLRIQYQLLEKNRGISENTNAAIRMAGGDYIVLADHDDLLAPNALYECVKAMNQDPGIDLLYSDEDKVDLSGKKFFEPHFKPDYNIDLLCSMNYICHLFVVKRTVIEQVGMLRREFDGAQDHDLILRCCEQAGRIYHIPKVLYHWRCHMDSTVEQPESKLYAFEAGRRAVKEHYERLGIPAVVEHSSFFGIYRTRYQWKAQPLVSIIIPNKDHIEELKTCIDSIDLKSTYRNYEYVIVENNSIEEATFEYYKELGQRENVSIVYYDGGFNYSKINNFGVASAKGDYLLLLNNDTELISPDGIEDMLGYCMREDVGIVGAKLCYPDDTIQHAGVVLGFGGMAGHTFIGASRFDLGYMGRMICAQDYSAVTAACLMTKKEIYERVGGLTEAFEVAFNDIDYCLKVRELGKLVVYDPYAELYHYESKSRGLEDTPEKIERFNGEVEKLRERWKDLLRKGDPYYNPNLTLDKFDFSLKV